MSNRYDIKDIRELLTQPQHIEKVINRLYGGTAVEDKTHRAFLLGDVEGAAGQSCRFETVGKYAGRWRDFNPSASRTHGDLIDAYEAKENCTTAQAIQAIGDLLGAPARLRVVSKAPEPKAAAQEPPKSAADDLAPISPETLRKSRGRLKKGSPPWAYLEGRGLDPAALKDRFGVGLAGLFRPKPGEEGQPCGQWLQTPVVHRDGSFLKRMMKIAVPDYSVNPVDKNGWCAGSPITYWSGPAEGKTWLFVAEGVKDLWRIWTAIQGTSLEPRMAIISSTHGSGIPQEWKDTAFWLGWDRVYLGQDNDDAGEAVANKIRALAKRDFLRVEPPREVGKDWTDFFEADDRARGIVDFEKALAEARPLGQPRPEIAPAVPLAELEDGIYEDRRVNINAAFTNGAMYYPFQVRRVRTVRRRQELPDGTSVMVPEKSSYYETRVVRSDGAMLGITTAPAPYGVEAEDKVIVLDDGTEVLSIPRPREYSTWTWPQISKFVDAMQAGKAPHRPLREILSDVLNYLRQLTWLPHETDYHLLTTYVAMSYCYNAFDAIPMLLLNGEKGSGKSSLAEGLADLSFNGHMLGGGSEKAFVRFVDQGRGLLVLDDLESVGRRGHDDGGYGDINQILKVGYSKATALKSVVEKSGATRTLNFYCPKVVTNISGIDAVNATRMYMILCRPMPEAVKESGRIKGRDIEISEPLRQELHAWGMANILDAHQLYRAKSANRAGRAEQIAAPLETIAEMTGDTEFDTAVRSAIRRLAANKGDHAGAEEILAQAVDAIIERGARKMISLAQIKAELALIPESRVLESPHAVPSDLHPLQDPTSIGRLLNTLGIRTSAAGPRVRLSGQLVRCYELDPDYVQSVLDRAEVEGRYVEQEYQSRDHKRLGLAFCEGQACAVCAYRTVCSAALPHVREGKGEDLRHTWTLKT